MADTPTQRDLFLAGRAEAILSPTRFDRAILDTEGSDVNTIVNVAAAMGQEVARYLQVVLNELGLATAREEALDRWVFDRYQLTRKEASSALAQLTLTRVTTSGGFTIEAGSQFATETGVVFSTQNDASFASGSTGPLTVAAIADQTGREGNVEADSITDKVTALPDSTVTVTNTEAASGGNPREDDDELRDRARGFYLTARRGTRDAIEYGALQAGRVKQAAAVESFEISTGLPGYRVLLNIADANGQANSALASEVGRSLDGYRALGVPVLVIPAVPQYISITASGLAFAAGSNTTLVVQQAKAAVLAYVNGIAPGATLRRADLLAALTSVTKLVVPAAALTEPAGDLVPSTGTVIRTTLDRITLTG